MADTIKPHLLIKAGVTELCGRMRSAAGRGIPSCMFILYFVCFACAAARSTDFSVLALSAPAQGIDYQDSGYRISIPPQTMDPEKSFFSGYFASVNQINSIKLILYQGADYNGTLACTFDSSTYNGADPIFFTLAQSGHETEDLNHLKYGYAPLGLKIVSNLVDHYSTVGEFVNQMIYYLYGQNTGSFAHFYAFKIPVKTVLANGKDNSNNPCNLSYGVNYVYKFVAATTSGSVDVNTFMNTSTSQYLWAFTYGTKNDTPAIEFSQYAPNDQVSPDAHYLTVDIQPKTDGTLPFAKVSSSSSAEYNHIERKIIIYDSHWNAICKSKPKNDLPMTYTGGSFKFDTDYYKRNLVSFSDSQYRQITYNYSRTAPAGDDFIGIAPSTECTLRGDVIYNYAVNLTDGTSVTEIQSGKSYDPIAPGDDSIIYSAEYKKDDAGKWCVELKWLNPQSNIDKTPISDLKSTAVYRKDKSGTGGYGLLTQTPLDATILSFKDYTAVDGKSYIYVLVSYDVAGNNTQSANEYSFTPKSHIVSNIKHTSIGDKKVKLTWDAPTIPSEHGYYVYLSSDKSIIDLIKQDPDGKKAECKNACSSKFTLQEYQEFDVVDGTEYYAIVTVVKDAGHTQQFDASDIYDFKFFSETIDHARHFNFHYFKSLDSQYPVNNDVLNILEGDSGVYEGILWPGMKDKYCQTSGADDHCPRGTRDDLDSAKREDDQYRIDVYLTDPGSLYAGLANDISPCRITLDNDYGWGTTNPQLGGYTETKNKEDGLRAVAGHEFFHCIQYYYTHTNGVSDWLTESTPDVAVDDFFPGYYTWQQRIQKNGNNGYLGENLDFYVSGTNNDFKEYQLTPFFKYLEKTHPDNATDRILKDLFQKNKSSAAKMDSEKLIYDTLQDHGKNFNDIYTGYAISNVVNCIVQAPGFNTCGGNYHETSTDKYIPFGRMVGAYQKNTTPGENLIQKGNNYKLDSYASTIGKGGKKKIKRTTIDYYRFRIVDSDFMTDRKYQYKAAFSMDLCQDCQAYVVKVKYQKENINYFSKYEHDSDSFDFTFNTPETDRFEIHKVNSGTPFFADFDPSKSEYYLVVIALTDGTKFSEDEVEYDREVSFTRVLTTECASKDPDVQLAGVIGNKTCDAPTIDYGDAFKAEPDKYTFKVNPFDVTLFSFPFSAKDSERARTAKEIQNELGAGNWGLTDADMNKFVNFIGVNGTLHTFPATEDPGGNLGDGFFPALCFFYTDKTTPTKCYNGWIAQTDHSGKYLPNWCALSHDNDQACTSPPFDILGVDWTAGSGFYSYGHPIPPADYFFTVPADKVQPNSAGVTEVPIYMGTNIVGPPYLGDGFSPDAISVKMNGIEKTMDKAVDDGWIINTVTSDNKDKYSPFLKMEYVKGRGGDAHGVPWTKATIDFVLTPIKKADKLLQGGGYVITASDVCLDTNGPKCFLVFNSGGRSAPSQGGRGFAERVLGKQSVKDAVAWYYSIQATSEHGNSVTGDYLNQFGLSASAEDGANDLLDQAKNTSIKRKVNLPGAGGDLLNYVYMSFKAGQKDLMSDFRKLTDDTKSKTWIFTVEQPVNDTKIKLQWWQEKNIPSPYARLILLDTVTSAQIDMLTYHEYEYAANGLKNRPFNIIYEIRQSPQITAPKDGDVFEKGVDNVAISWNPVSEAVWYRVELQLPDSRIVWDWVRTNSLKITDFVKSHGLGAYKCRVRALNKSLAPITEYSQWTGFVLTLPAPALISPDQFQFIPMDELPELKWTSVTGASGYSADLMRIDPTTGTTSDVFSDLRVTATILNNLNGWITVFPDEIAHIYTWRVRALDENGNPGRTSESRRFGIYNPHNPLPPPIIISPIDGNRETDGGITLKWSPIDTAYAYEVTIVGKDPATSGISYTKRFDWDQSFSRRNVVLGNFNSLGVVLANSTSYATILPVTPEEWKEIGETTGYLEYLLRVIKPQKNYKLIPNYLDKLTDMPDGLYEWKVTAFDKDGNAGGTSVPYTFIKDSRPEMPAGLAAETESQTVRLNWTSLVKNVDGRQISQDTGDVPQIKIMRRNYEWECTFYEDGSSLPLCTTIVTLPYTATAYTDSGLTDSWTYDYAVFAVNSKQVRGVTNNLYMVIPFEKRYQPAPPGWARNYGGVAKPGGISPFWQPVTGATSYKIGVEHEIYGSVASPIICPGDSACWTYYSYPGYTLNGLFWDDKPIGNYKYSIYSGADTGGSIAWGNTPLEITAPVFVGTPAIGTPRDCNTSPFCGYVDVSNMGDATDLKFIIYGRSRLVLNYFASLDSSPGVPAPGYPYNPPIVQEVPGYGDANVMHIQKEDLLHMLAYAGNPEQMTIMADGVRIDGLGNESVSASSVGYEQYFLILNPGTGSPSAYPTTIVSGLRAKTDAVPSVKLSWDISGASGVLGYRVYRSATPITSEADTLNADSLTPFWGDPATKTEYIDTGANFGATYYYAVSAVMNDGTLAGLSESLEVVVPSVSQAHVSGTVSSDLGALSGVSVYAVNEITLERAAGLSDNSGNYAMTLSGGTWKVKAVAPAGYALLNPPTVAVNSYGQIISGVDILFSKAAIDVHGVVDDGFKYMNGAVVTADNGSAVISSKTFLSGNFTLVLGLGAWNISVNYPGYKIENVSINISGSSPGPAPLAIHLKPFEYEIYGKVSDAAGAPLYGVLIQAFGPSTANPAVTDQTGSFHVSVSEGIWSLRAIKNGYVPSERDWISVMENEGSPDSVDFALERITSSVTGMVTDDDGSPKPGARIFAAGPYSESVFTQPDGRYTMYLAPSAFSEAWFIQSYLDGYEARPDRRVVWLPGNGAAVENQNFQMLSKPLHDLDLSGPVTSRPEVIYPGEILKLTAHGKKHLADITARVEDSRTGVTLIPNITFTEDASSPGTYKAFVTIPLSEPFYQFTILDAVALAGDCRANSKNVIMLSPDSSDTVPPEIVSMAAAPNPFSAAQGGTSAKIIFSEPALITSYSITSNDGTTVMHTETQQMAILDGNDYYWQLSWNGQNESGATVESGEYVLRAFYQDYSGNKGVSPAELRIVFDKTPPTFSHLYPDNGSVLSESPRSISINVTDNPFGAGVDYSALTLLLRKSENPQDYQTMNWQLLPDSLTVTAAIDPLLEDGSYSVTAKARDKIYNANIMTWNFSVSTDKTPPEIKVDIPSPVIEGGEYLLDAGATFDPSPGSGVRSIEWDIDGDGVFESAGATASCSWPNDGVYWIKVRATDNFQNAAVKEYPVNVNNFVPVANIVVSPATVQYSDTANFQGAHQDQGTRDSWYYSWNYGDGAASVFGPYPSFARVSHRFMAQAGYYTVTLNVMDDSGKGTYATATVNVLKEDARLSPIGASNGRYMDILPLSASLSELDGETGDLSGKTITWRVGAQSASAVTDTSGTAETSLLLEQQPGAYTIETSFAGDGYYAGIFATGGFTIEKEKTTLAYTGDAKGRYSDPISLGALLTDDEGTVLKGKTIVWTVGSQTASAVTDDTGVASATLVLAQKPGDFTVAASFSEDENFLASSATDSFTIEKENTVLTYTGDSSEQFSDVTDAGAVLKDADVNLVPGDPDPGIDGKAVSFLITSGGAPGDLGNATTGTDGACSTAIPITQKSGRYSVSAKFPGDDYYLPAEDTRNFAIEKEDAVLSYTGDTTEQYSDVADLKAELKDTDGNLVPGDACAGIDSRLVSFLITSDGTSGDAVAATTAVDGTANAPAQVTRKPLLPASVKANFAGDEYYLPAHASTPFTVTKENVLMTISNITGDFWGLADGTRGDVRSIGVDLRDEDASSITPIGKDAPLPLALNYSPVLLGTAPIPIAPAQAVTGKEDVRLPLPFESPGIFTLNLAFTGNDYYNAVSATSSLTVQDSTTPNAAIETPGLSNCGLCRLVNGDIRILGMANDVHPDSGMLPLNPPTPDNFKSFTLGYAPGYDALEKAGAALPIAIDSRTFILNGEALSPGDRIVFGRGSEATRDLTMDTLVYQVASAENSVIEVIPDIQYSTVLAVGNTPDVYVDNGIYSPIQPETAEDKSGELLGAWQTSALPEGNYTLKLTVDETLKPDGTSKPNESVSVSRLTVVKPVSDLIPVSTITIPIKPKLHPSFDATPNYLAIDATGSLYVSTADSMAGLVWSGSVFKIAPDGTMGTVCIDNNLFEDFKNLFGKGATVCKVDKPEGVALDGAGNIYVADSRQHVVMKVAPNGQVLNAFGRVHGIHDGKVSGSPGHAPGEFDHPGGIAVDTAGNIYVADSENGRVQVLGPDGAVKLVISNLEDPLDGGSQQGAPPEEQCRRHMRNMHEFMMGGHRLCSDADTAQVRRLYRQGLALFFTGRFGEALEKFQAAHAIIGACRDAGLAKILRHPMDVAVDNAGYIYVADRNNDRIVKFDSAGKFVAVFGEAGSGRGQLNKPEGVKVGTGGYVYVSDQNNSRVQKFDPFGNPVLELGAEGRKKGEMHKPHGLALLGCDTRLYLADGGNRRVEIFGSDEFPATLPDFVSSIGNYPEPVETERGTTIFFRVGKPVSVSASILDKHGNAVRTFTDFQIIGSDYSVYWDGRSADGTRAAPGDYIVEITAGSSSKRIEIMVVH